jgi:hypothetical protein
MPSSTSLPSFDAQGNLPSGVHRIQWDEIEQIFGRITARRRLLFGRLEEIVRLARSTGFLARVFIWGSFVTNKALPRDLDLFLLMRQGFDLVLPQLAPSMRELFDHMTARLRYEADVFWATEVIGEVVLAEFLSVYQMTREFTARGIIEVVFDDPE